MTRSSLVAFFVLPAVMFALAYFPIVNRLSVGLVSPYARAGIGKRLYAAALDGLIVITIAFLYLRLESVGFAIVAALYLLFRDGAHGRSVGKFCCGLVVVSLENGQPATMIHSVRRNAVLLLPGANLVAIFLETMTLMRDPQGQRLGDRLAQTQVVEGLGARDLVSAFHEWWLGVLPEIVRAGRPKRAPVGVDR